MKALLYGGILGLAFLGLGHLRAQTPGLPQPTLPIATSNQPGAISVSPVPVASNASVLAPNSTSPENSIADDQGNVKLGGPPPYPPGINDYLGYLRPAGCCAPVGSQGPITTEVFLRNGVSFPLSGNLLGRILHPGYMIQGGGRSLFFTPERDRAFTLELGISSVWYDAGKDVIVDLQNVQRPLRNDFGQIETNSDGAPVIQNIPRLPVWPSSLNQTYVHLSAGHEYFLWGDPDCSNPECRLRAGYDVGGRWGTSKMILVKMPYPEEGKNRNKDLFNHRVDVVGGMFLALHSDFEIPYRCCVLFAGVRTEMAYIWSDILQSQNNCDLFQLNLLFNFGARF